VVEKIPIRIICLAVMLCLPASCERPPVPLRGEEAVLFHRVPIYSCEREAVLLAECAIRAKTEAR
jgi:hypothetical protein